MATRKSDGGPPDDDKGAARPGSYVKISGSRRRRKGKKQGAGTMSNASAARSAVDERGSAPPAGEHDEGGDDSFDYAVDDLRPSRTSPSPSRQSWRPPGPLGMNAGRADESGERSGAAQKGPEAVLHGPTASPAGAAPGDSAARSATDGLTPAQRVQIDEELYRELSEPPPRASSPDASPVRPAVLIRDEAHQSVLIGEEVPRHSLSSVLGARPSLRPSPPAPAPGRAALVWWVGVALLVGIIAAAAAVAVRERLHEDVAQQAPSSEVQGSNQAPVVPREPAVLAPFAPEALLAAPPAPPAQARDVGAAPAPAKVVAPRTVRARRPAPRPTPAAPIPPPVAPIPPPVAPTPSAPAAADRAMPPELSVVPVAPAPAPPAPTEPPPAAPFAPSAPGQ